MAKTRFTNLISSIPEEASVKKWKVLYDAEIDGLYWTKNKMSEDSSLYKVSHDTYLYLTPKKELEGVFVEYFKTNFTEHNKQYKKVFRYLNKKVDGDSFTLSSKGKGAEEIFSKFSLELKADIFEEALEEKGQLKNLNALLSVRA